MKKTIKKASTVFLSGHRWQRRWCVASGHHLRYFEFESQTEDGDLRAAIDLDRVKIQPTKGQTFELHLDDGTVIAFRASSITAAIDWCTHLKSLQERRGLEASNSPLNFE
jgi:hypothetical protein